MVALALPALQVTLTLAPTSGRPVATTPLRVELAEPDEGSEVFDVELSPPPPHALSMQAVAARAIVVYFMSASSKCF